MEDGIWRTVSGRRIFIKDGQSLSDAINKSGKFKKSSKNRTIKNDDEYDLRRWAEEDERLENEDNDIFERFKAEESNIKKSKRK